ncbi:hypothetical protein [Nesterenkonia alba]|uniref:hypothetical protein n=1 Tax=Nesterenkonia alba TaxID=515814 RepID=UPI0003B66E2B|nr:hypothetical protein [Nesterenkonia alba]
METLYKTTGLLGVALLALTACGDTGEDPDGHPEDEGVEGQDPDGAEDQGDAPEEIAGEDDGEGNGADPDDDTQDAPELAEIEEDIWESSLDGDSVTITSEISAAAMGADQIDPDIDPTETTEITIAGDVEGDGFLYGLPTGDFLVFDDAIYQSVEDFVETYESSAPEGAELEIDPDQLRSALAAEGEWVEVTTDYADHVQSPAEFIEYLRQSFGDDLGEDAPAGELDTRDGENVWVYGQEDEDISAEIVVHADESEPLLHSLSGAQGDETVEVTFTDWDETDEPERPDDEEIIDEAEFEQIAESLL